MIVNSDKKREVGQVHTGGIYVNGEVSHQPLLILRECTFEEWARWVTESGDNPDEYPSPGPFFYEVHSD